MHDSGASRREIANVYLELALLFEDFEVGACAKRYLASRHKMHPSCPDLIRHPSIFVKSFPKKRDHRVI